MDTPSHSRKASPSLLGGVLPPVCFAPLLCKGCSLCLNALPAIHRFISYVSFKNGFRRCLVWAAFTDPCTKLRALEVLIRPRACPIRVFIVLHLVQLPSKNGLAW